MGVSKRHVDVGLKKLWPPFNDLYEAAGRPGLPPGPRLQLRVLSARSGAGRERRFCEPRGSDLRRRWVLDREPGEGRFNPSVVAGRHVRLWAPARQHRVIAAAATSQVANGINTCLRLFKPDFIHAGRKAGVKFTVGANNPSAGPPR